MVVTDGAAITLPPTNQAAVVNRTVFLVCEASFPKDVDMIYEWTFNGYPLYYDLIHFRQVINKSVFPLFFSVVYSFGLSRYNE